MAFDRNLDKELFGETIEFETTKLRISVYSYNEGRKKLQISRQNFNPNTEEFTFAKMGRLTKEEAQKAIPLMQKALEHMD